MVVEFVGAALRDEAGRDGKLQEILKFDVARTIEEGGRGEIDGADCPEADGENEGVGANAARGEATGSAIKPGGCSGRTAHGRGSAFLRESVIDCEGRGVVASMRQPSSY